MILNGTDILAVHEFGPATGAVASGMHSTGRLVTAGGLSSWRPLPPTPGEANVPLQEPGHAFLAAMNCSGADRRGETSEALCRTSDDTCAAATLLADRLCEQGCDHACAAAGVSAQEVCGDSAVINRTCGGQQPGDQPLQAAVDMRGSVDISALHAGIERAFPVITLTLPPSYMDFLLTTVNVFFDFDVHVSIVDGTNGAELLSHNATAHVRGKGTLSPADCPRRGLTIALDDDSVANILGAPMKKFYLVAMCEDATYATMASSMHIARRLGLWKAAFSFVELRLSSGGDPGDVATQGLYLLMERPEDAIKDQVAGNTMIVRSSSDRFSSEAEIKHPSGPLTNATEVTFRSYRELYQCRRQNASYMATWMRERLDLETYMTWLAFNTVLHNGGAPS